MERKRLLQAGVFTVASMGVAFAAKEAVNYVNSWATPRYINSGNPAPLTAETPDWQRPTNWNPRVYIVDGRDGKTYKP